MKNLISDINFNKEDTNSYHDKYNLSCQCRECTLFRNHFAKDYPLVADFLSNFGIDLLYPLEIVDNGIDDTTLTRNYLVYYCVKGSLPCDKIEDYVEHTPVVLRNYTIAGEAYNNTGMKEPYFIIEIKNIFIRDNEGVITTFLEMGREIEFHFEDCNYFMSRHDNSNWYLYNEETQEKQDFPSYQAMLSGTIIDNKQLNMVWNEIIIDCVL